MVLNKKQLLIFLIPQDFLRIGQQPRVDRNN